jgi:enoyl-CoA hydratase/carnithine racemase
MSDEEKRVIVERMPETKVARVILNRPDKRNAIDGRMLEEWMRAMDSMRSDPEVRVVITKANGPTFCAGLDLHYLREFHKIPPGDWERCNPPRALYDSIRDFPKVTIAQIHGYCVGGGLVAMMSHDLAFAAKSAQLGMPEIIRGSFGQMATSNLFHSGIPMKKAAMIQFTGYNVSGAEADSMGLVSHSVEDAELDAYTLKVGTAIASYHPGAIASAKVAIQMGNKLPLTDAMKMDGLVYAWQQLLVDPLADVEGYLKSQAGGTKPDYKRPDV